MITVFTATYNRAHLLPKLYQSLLQQTVKDFEWVIVDDGSNDNTKSIVSNFIAEQLLNIRFYKKENGGKHTAINKGVLEARGSHFFNVDSDDILPSNAIEKVIKTVNLQEASYPKLGGIALRKAYFDNSLVGDEIPNTPLVANSYSIRYQHGVTGDLAEIYSVDILKQFPFPENDERFCPEVLVWHRIANHYDLLFTNDIVYHCEYIQGGLTANITKIRMNSPINTCQTYLELFQKKGIGWKHNCKALINFWRFYYCASAEKKQKIAIPKSILNIVARLMGKILHKKDIKGKI